MNTLLTILIPTNLIQSAPDVKIIKQTIYDLEKHIGLIDCNIIIGMDCKYKDSIRFNQYLNNIKNIKTKFNIKIVISKTTSIYGNFTHLVDQCKTKYFFIIEHDWILNTIINFNTIIDVMEKYNFINTIRFSFNQITHAWDTITKNAEISELPLVKTNGWSNHPKIVRTTSWYNDIKYAKPNGDIEFDIWKAYLKDIEKLSFDNAQYKWGQYIYGDKNKDIGLLIHLDGRLTK